MGAGGDEDHGVRAIGRRRQWSGSPRGPWLDGGTKGVEVVVAEAVTGAVGEEAGSQALQFESAEPCCRFR